MTLEVNGIALNYEQEGTGHDLLFIPGLGASAPVWYPQLKAFSSAFRVTIVEPRGHGRSAKPPGPYTIVEMAADIAAFIRALGMRKPFVVGSSMGALIAAELAAAERDLLGGLVLVGGFVRLTPAGRERMEARIAAAESDGMEAFVDSIVAGALGATTHANQPGLVGLFRSLLLQNDPRAYAAATRAVVDCDLSDRLGGIRCPTLILLGAEEQVAPPSAATALRTKLKVFVKLQLIPAAGHLPFLEQPAAFNATLQEWLSSPLSGLHDEFSSPRLGVVSNAWASLLPESALEKQCRRAMRADFDHVELRQRALGDCEELVSGDDRPWPIPERLAALRSEFPALGMNLAVEAPFLTQRVELDDYLTRCAQAARALARQLGCSVLGVLRLVDLSPSSALLSVEDLAARARDLSELASQVRKNHGVYLAVENSRQPVEPLLSLLRQARKVSDLPRPAIPPQLCWDPANQVTQKLAAEDPVETARSLTSGELFEYHFKQLRNGELLPSVEDGDLDWRAILAAMPQACRRKPALFEIPPGPDIWDRLEASAAYIRGILATL